MHLVKGQKEAQASLLPILFLTAFAGVAWVLYTSPTANPSQEKRLYSDILGPASEQRPNSDERFPLA